MAPSNTLLNLLSYLLSSFFIGCVCVFTQSCPTLCDPWTVAHQSPLSLEFSRPEYWSMLPFPSPGNLPNPGIKPVSLMSLVLAGGFFTTSTTWEFQGSPEGTQKNTKGNFTLFAFSSTWKSADPGFAHLPFLEQLSPFPSNST